jgi:hypothetical protein
VSDGYQRTARGLRIYAEIEDANGSTVRVQQSSAGGMEHVRIYTSNADGAAVMHWRAGGGWEPAPRVGASDPPWREGDPLRPSSEGWQAVSPHLDPDGCRALIAALQAHLDAIGGAS